MANFVLVPLLAYGISLIIPLEDSLKIGLLILAASAARLSWSWRRKAPGPIWMRVTTPARSTWPSRFCFANQTAVC
jgi:hypothetical protein